MDVVRNLFRWRPGRQGSGYFKMLLAQGSSWDCYLMRYPTGSHVPTHHDPVHGRRHFRLNVALRGTQDVVELLGPPIARGRRWLLFRPDVVSHRMTPVERPRLELSIGWTLPAEPFDAWSARP